MGSVLENIFQDELMNVENEYYEFRKLRFSLFCKFLRWQSWILFLLKQDKAFKTV